MNWVLVNWWGWEMDEFLFLPAVGIAKQPHLNDLTRKQTVLITKLNMWLPLSVGCSDLGL